MHSHADVSSYPTAKNALVQVSESPDSAAETLIGRMRWPGRSTTASDSAWWDSQAGLETSNNGLRDACRGDGAARIGSGFKRRLKGCRSVLT
jgi:hypothetical protein